MYSRGLLYSFSFVDRSLDSRVVFVTGMFVVHFFAFSQGHNDFDFFMMLG